MSTRFCGHLTGFNPKGDNDMVPNEFGPPATTFGGRSAVPAGPLKRFPGAVADIDDGNRRLAKAKHGEGGGSGATFGGRSAFDAKRAGMGTGRKPGGMRGGKNMEMNRK